METKAETLPAKDNAKQKQHHYTVCIIGVVRSQGILLHSVIIIIIIIINIIILIYYYYYYYYYYYLHLIFVVSKTIFRFILLSHVITKVISSLMQALKHEIESCIDNINNISDLPNSSILHMFTCLCNNILYNNISYLTQWMIKKHF